MPTNLTPEQIAAIQRYYAQSNSGYVNPTLMNMDGMAYQPYDQFSQPSGEAGIGAPQATGGYFAYDPEKTKPGDTFSNYGADGTFSNEGQFKDMSGLDPLLLAFLAAAGGMAFGLPGMMGAEGAGAGAGAGAISGPGISTVNGMTTFGVVDPAISWGAGAAGGAAGGAVGASAAGGGGGSATMAPLELMPTSGLGEALTPMAGPAGGLGGIKGLLGPAATLLGGLAGSQGQKSESTSTRKSDPRVDPYIFGGNGQPGLLAQVSALLGRDNSEAQDALFKRSMSLLNTPQMGNGYTKYAPPKFPIYGGR